MGGQIVDAAMNEAGRLWLTRAEEDTPQRAEGCRASARYLGRPNGSFNRLPSSPQAAHPSRLPATTPAGRMTTRSPRKSGLWSA